MLFAFDAGDRPAKLHRNIVQHPSHARRLGSSAVALATAEKHLLALAQIWTVHLYGGDDRISFFPLLSLPPRRKGFNDNASGQSHSEKYFFSFQRSIMFQASPSLRIHKNILCGDQVEIYSRCYESSPLVQELATTKPQLQTRAFDGAVDPMKILFIQLLTMRAN